MIEILFENDDIIALNKPEGIATIPERTKGSGSLIEAVRQETQERVFVVHRLDKEVSGVLLVARNPEAHRFLNEAFGSRRVEKTYRALVCGILSGEGGIIDRPIRQFGSGRMGIDDARGKPSVTAYSVLEAVGKFTELHAFPRTGRRHQIRVHLYAIGHPVVGDRRYGTGGQIEGSTRLMLHAEAIQFALPTGEVMTIRSPIPGSYREFLNRLRMEEPHHANSDQQAADSL